MGFLHTNFQLARPFHSRLRVRHGTDTETTAINALCLRPMGAGALEATIQGAVRSGCAFYCATQICIARTCYGNMAGCLSHSGIVSIPLNIT